MAREGLEMTTHKGVCASIGIRQDWPCEFNYLLSKANDLGLDKSYLFGIRTCNYKLIRLN